MHELGLNTDYLTASGSPKDCLRRIAEAGFSHVMWCHQWNTDFLYGEPEWAAIAGWLREYHLRLMDIHATHGKEKCWYSTVEYERQAGVELVANRLRMLKRLDGEGVLTLHPPYLRDWPAETPAADREKYAALAERQFEAMCKSLDDLAPLLRQEHVRIAVENLPHDNWVMLKRLLDRFPPEILGITYDSGHGNIADLPGETPRLDDLEALSGRLLALHLHDNHGAGDEHLPPFLGTVNWKRLAGILAHSPDLGRPLVFEVGVWNMPGAPEKHDLTLVSEEFQRRFLCETRERAERVAQLVEAAKA